MKRAFVAIAAGAMVAAAIVRYPPDPALRFDPALLVVPEAQKLRAVLLSCAWLLVLDLAAYAAGRVLHRALRGPVRVTALGLLERMGLGSLALACTVLALAAVHALHRPVIVAAVTVLAALGAVAAWRDVRPPVLRPRRVVIAAGVAVLLASPFLAAGVPDYGYDAFAYHLALPERYLFRNRIVLTPLYPHSAFPQTVEMLYLIALSLDSGALAKLIHLQLAVFTAAAVFAVARTASARAGWLAVVILAADPLFNWEATVAYNDLAAALFTVLAAAAFHEWRRDASAAALRMAGLFAGACVAVRYPAALVPIAMALLVWLPAPWHRWRSKVRATAVLAAFATFVLSPWLVRNAVFTGNPLAPTAQTVFHRAGQEYFNPTALAQSVAFTHAAGFGRGIDDFLLLPVNLTLRARIGDYTAFGFRAGVLYVAGALAFLVLGGDRRSAAGTSSKLAGIITVFWFFAAQEPRYLLPALCLAAIAGGIGLDLLLARRRGPALLLWLIPAAALLHAQWSAIVLLPYRYGYALGGLSVAGFESQEPALALVPALRHVMGPGDRLLPIHEARGYFYRGLDYVPASPPEVMQLVHEAPTPAALADRLRALGITHVLVNANSLRLYRTWYVEGYGPREHEEDLRRLDAFLAGHTTPVIEDRGVFVRKLLD
jgi:4-amino-4-deoxy-L-arabinose transferase-like glycosyltransferase